MQKHLRHSVCIFAASIIVICGLSAFEAKALVERIIAEQAGFQTPDSTPWLDPPSFGGIRHPNNILEFPRDPLKLASDYFKEVDQNLDPVIRYFANPQRLNDPASFFAGPILAPLTTTIGIGYLEANPLPGDVAEELKKYVGLDGITFTLRDISSARWISSDKSSGNILTSTNFGMDSITWDALIVAGPALRNATGCERIGKWAHEIAHVHQYAREGISTFLGNYLTEYGRHGYENSRQEIEARNVENLVREKCVVREIANSPESSAPGDWKHLINIENDNCWVEIVEGRNPGPVQWRKNKSLIIGTKKSGGTNGSALICHYKLPFFVKVLEVGFVEMNWTSKPFTNHPGRGGGRGIYIYGGVPESVFKGKRDFSFFRRKEERASLPYETIKYWRSPVVLNELGNEITVVTYLGGSWRSRTNRIILDRLYIRAPGNVQVSF